MSDFTAGCDQPSNTTPTDAVRISLTTTIESDFISRGVFSELRRANACETGINSSRHVVTMGRAESVLEDALARQRSARKGMLIAYNAWVNAITAKIKEAMERHAELKSDVAVCVNPGDWREVWRGTKVQLTAQGIQLAGPWPGEPGGKDRWAQARDSRGYKTKIRCLSEVWSGRYQACIVTPDAVWAAKDNETAKSAEADRAKRNLSFMPDSASDFRAQLVDNLRMMVRTSIEKATTPASHHGYTLDEDAVGEIHASFDAFVEAVVGAPVKFDLAHHAEIAQRYRAQIAAGDRTFQARFATLVCPNPRILEGSAR